MMQSAPSRDTKPRQLRARMMASSRPFGRVLDTRSGLIKAGAAGLFVGSLLFVGALFAYTPKASAGRVLGTDGRIIGIPKNCDEARAARIAPMAKGSGFYNPKLDNDRDGLACKPNLFGF
jgi:hypothetical protein